MNYFCENCQDETPMLIMENHEICCDDCGMVVKECDQVFESNFEENNTKTYYRNIKPLKNEPIKYFKRKMRCLRATQRVCIPQKLIEEIKENIRDVNKKTVRKFLRTKKLTKHYPDVNLIIQEVTGKEMLIPDHLMNDIENLYRLFLIEYFHNEEIIRFNIIKTPPVDYVCRMIVEYISFYSELYNVSLPYDPFKYKELFADMKSYRKIANRKIIDDTLNEVNFHLLYWKYKDYK